MASQDAASGSIWKSINPRAPKYAMNRLSQYRLNIRAMRHGRKRCAQKGRSDSVEFIEHHIAPGFVPRQRHREGKSQQESQ